MKFGRLGRPFGVAMLFASVDHSGPHLFHLDPSGTYIKCLVKAIGAGGDGRSRFYVNNAQIVTSFFLENTLIKREKFFCQMASI
jgi:hypothetical protein